MTDDIPSILSHVSVGTNDFARAVAFYDAVLPVLGCHRAMEHPAPVLEEHPGETAKTRPASPGTSIEPEAVVPTGPASPCRSVTRNLTYSRPDRRAQAHFVLPELADVYCAHRQLFGGCKPRWQGGSRVVGQPCLSLPESVDSSRILR